jgi:hypothetical protein
MKTVVILQSNYLPWKGYFDLVHDADLFIFYDDIQYTKNDWRNRNKVKTPKGPEWLTIPVGISKHRLICEVELRNTAWQKKHWKTILQNYGKCQYFALYKDFFEDVYLERKWDNLSDLNQFLIRKISSEFLNIQTAFHDSRNYALTGTKGERLLELLVKTGAEQYVSGPAAKDYIDSFQFNGAGINIVWKDYSGYPDYPQRFPPFEHNVSIVDVLFNVGPDASWYIWGWRSSGEKLR